MASVAMADRAEGRDGFPALSDFVADECERRLRAYEAQPRDANEHYETEVEVLSGGYAYRQLFELVQNAADAIGEGGEGSGRIQVSLDRSRLVAANTGAALDRDGVVALLNARSSSKRAGQIGRFGIGFKSLLKLGGTVDLVSRTIGLRFDPEWCRGAVRARLGLGADARAPGMRLARVLDPSAPESPLWRYGDLAWATTVVMAAIHEPGVYERLADEMAAFPAEFVLFLEADVELVLEVDSGLRRTITRRRDGDVFVVDDGTVETRWRLFQTRVRMTDASALSDAQHIQARDEVPLAWAVPVGGREVAGRFWAFFPTQSETYTSGILNAPWKLNSDRTNVIGGEWNAALMREAARLMADSFPALSTPEDPGGPVGALPRQLERKDDLAAGLVEPLWALLVDRPVVADGAGRLRSSGELCRHPVNDGDVLRWWSALAPPAQRESLVHPSCQTGDRRASRLAALARETAERSPKEAAPVLRQWTEVEWLEAAASAEAMGAIPFLHFVEESVVRRKQLAQHRARQARIVPTAGGALVVASEAIVAPASRAPSGLHPVLAPVAENERARAVLTGLLGVRELSEGVWEELLDESRATASVGETDDWLIFWANLAEAPVDAARAFGARTAMAELRFRSLAGAFEPREVLVVPEEADRARLAPAIVMDVAFHDAHRDRVPAGALDTFPAVGSGWVDDWDGLAWGKMKPFFDKVEQLGWPRVPGNPQHSKMGVLDRERIRMPSGWRLLPLLPPALAATLSIRLIEAMARDQRGRKPAAGEGQPSFPAITYGHSTRRDTYATLSAHHPLLFWLQRFGILPVGDALVRFKSLPVEALDALAAAGQPAARLAQAAERAHRAPVDIVVGRDAEPLVPELRHRFWSAVFETLEISRERFDEFGPAWDRAAADGEIPGLVPTTDGPVPIGEVFVVARGDVAAAPSDDGRIVVLSDATAALWAAAGAQELSDATEVGCAQQLGDPLRLRDIFPELEPVLTTRPARRADAVWVRGLVERAGHRTVEPVLARDSTGLLMIDRERFRALPWVEGRTQILRALVSFGLLVGDPAELVRELATARGREARARVRAGADLPERLLLAVGGGAAPLLAILPNPVVEAAGGGLDGLAIAGLALAVHGPIVLTRLVDVFRAEGLEPPGQWGREDARRFVVELGFSLEFATSASVRREAEVLVSGPVPLPELHDYQSDILASLAGLLSSGEGRRRAVVSLPTGGGKTRVAAEAVVRLVLNGDGQRSALWVAQTDELCEQAVQCFRQLWSNVGIEGEDLRVVRLWGGQSSPTPPEAGEAIVVVASIQTLNARLEQERLEWLSRPGVVVIDECHHAIAPSYSSLLRWLDVQTGGEADREVEPPVLGLSATPWRGRDDDESARLAARFDRRWLPKDQEGLHAELRAKGVLAELRYTPIHYDRPVSLTDAAVRHFEQYGELPEWVVEEIGADPDRNDRIVERVLASGASSILLFANSVRHAQYLAARLHLAGCPAAAVSGETDRLARQHFIRRFRSGELRVLCNHSVLTTGFDAPRSDMILISRPVFSPVRYMQMVGRGLRGPANGGTETCEVATVEDNILNYRDRLAHHFCHRFFDVDR